ncbi:MAG: sugar transferase, partial [Acidobacteriota bacterium]|nr:sugar transferase [Acidobacteriota bacterium]
SSGPVLFLQERTGRHGRAFTIFKFRTLVHAADIEHHAVTTAANQRFTPVGPFLRRWKLDELPQLLNVLLGDMSLVGPRPKMPEHLVAAIPCRPGITGAATIAFGREEALLAQLPKEQLDVCYHTVILPTKHSLDAHYMAHATFLSDLKLIVNSVLRRWDDSILDSLPIVADLEAEMRMQQSPALSPAGDFACAPKLPSRKQPASAEQATVS